MRALPCIELNQISIEMSFNLLIHLLTNRGRLTSGLGHKDHCLISHWDSFLSPQLHVRSLVWWSICHRGYKIHLTDSLRGTVQKPSFPMARCETWGLEEVPSACSWTRAAATCDTRHMDVAIRFRVTLRPFSQRRLAWSRQTEAQIPIQWACKRAEDERYAFDCDGNCPTVISLSNHITYLAESCLDWNVSLST